MSEAGFGASGFHSAQSTPAAGSTSGAWRGWHVKATRAAVTAGSAVDTTVEPTGLEGELSVLDVLAEAPPRTLHIPAIVRSSPLSPSVRAMLESRHFGRRFDAVPLELDDVDAPLPGLACPTGDVESLTDVGSFEDLSLSIDALLAHRKRLLAATVDPTLPRRNVLVLGAGPGGLMTAVQLSLRDHHVVLCEPRESYTRNRFIGVYKEMAHLMAALGMPESMTYDFSHYRGKRGMMLADIQTYLHAVALKLGVIVYTGTVVRRIDGDRVRSGEVELVRANRSSTADTPAIGLTRWHHDSVARVRSGVRVRFDAIVDATGGRSGLRDVVVGSDNIVTLKEIARSGAQRDPSLQRFFEDPSDHCAEFVESDYGCPPELRAEYATALLGETDEIPDELPCFVSNIDASVLATPIVAMEATAGLAASVGGRQLDIPPDWIVTELRLTDGRLTRYHIEGPLPKGFGFGGRRLHTADHLDALNPVGFLVRVLYAMGMPFDAVDRQQLLDFYNVESSYGDASDVVSLWVGKFRGLRLGGDRPIWTGSVPGAESIVYAVVGEALQNAWYRFGTGVDDTFSAAVRFAEGLDRQPAEWLAGAIAFENLMIARSVQILYHLYGVGLHPDQGVIGPILAEYTMDQQRIADVAETRLRQRVREATEILAVEADLGAESLDPLLAEALDRQFAASCGAILELLDTLVEDGASLHSAAQGVRAGSPTWRSTAFEALATVPASERGELLTPLLEQAASHHNPDAQPLLDPTRREERLIELGLARHSWAESWLRVCAVRALDATKMRGGAALATAVSDRDPLVAEAAIATLSGREDGRFDTTHKVKLLAGVRLFATTPHDVLASVAQRLVERWVEADEQIFDKGDVGDCLYVIASGRVRIHDGDRTLRHLGGHEYFGELSLIDAETRSAAATAVEKTQLFRLSQEDFYPLMSNSIEIARSINAVLCAQLRTATATDPSPIEPNPHYV